MPPNEKPQLSSAEIALIQAWLAEGASFENRLGAFKQVSKIKGYLNSVLSQSFSGWPSSRPPAADPSRLRRRSFVKKREG